MIPWRWVLATLVALAGVLALGIALGGLTRWKPAPPTAAPAPAASPKPAARDRSSFFAKRAAPQPAAATPAVSTNPPPAPSPLAGTNVISNWQETMDDILRSDVETAAMGRTLLELLPRFPEAGQVEAAQHIVNLLEDEDYAPLTKVLADPATPEEILDVLLADLLNRPNALKLPALLSIVRQPNHAKASEAKEVLEVYLEEDFGTDWARWETRMRQWLKDNRD